MEEELDVKALGPTRDRTLAFPSATPFRHHIQSPRVRATSVVGGRNSAGTHSSLSHLLAGHALAIHEDVYSRHICPGA